MHARIFIATLGIATVLAGSSVTHAAPRVSLLAPIAAPPATVTPVTGLESVPPAEGSYPTLDIAPLVISPSPMASQPQRRTVRGQSQDAPDPDPVVSVGSGGSSTPAFMGDQGELGDPVPPGTLPRSAQIDSPEGSKQVKGIQPVIRTREENEERYNSGIVETRVKDTKWLEKFTSRRKGTLTGDTAKDTNVKQPEPFEALPSATAVSPNPDPHRKWVNWKFFQNWLPEPDPNLQGEHCLDRNTCQSDVGFTRGFISPVTNTFLAEDPRALSEFRPLYLLQTIPGSDPVFQGGNINFFGAQARIAFTEKWSLVLHKLGGLWINPGDNSVLGSTSGFSEVWLGPKWTFLRGLETQTLGAAGIQFQLPTGSTTAYQNTGSLSIVPYGTFSQRFLPTTLGTWNILDTFGYSISIDNERSDYLFNTLHIDLDVGNNDKIFPLMELNWYRYTSNGSSLPFASSEGRDLINFGSRVQGNNYLSFAAGARYKFTERMQMGAALEFPLIAPRDLFDFRFTLDFILRY